MNKRDSALVDNLLNEVFNVVVIQTDGYIGLNNKWCKSAIVAGHRAAVNIWATRSGWVYGTAGTFNKGITIPICSEEEFNRALWAGTAHRLPGLAKLACMID